MSGGGDKQETKTEPWSGVQPYLGRGYQAAEADILDRPQEFFPGQTYVDYSPETEQALALQTARAGANPLLSQAQDYTSGVLAGDYLGQNPYFDQLSDSVLSNVMPQVSSQFGGASGRFGSPAMAEALGRGVSRGMAPYLFQEYGAERGRQQQAAGMAPGMAQADYFDISQLGRVGAAREDLERLALQDEMARFQFGQQEPTQRLRDYMGILSGSSPLLGGAGTMTASAPGGGFSAGGAAGGALSGAASGALLGSAVPGIGTGVGALAGGLGGGLMGSGLF